MASPRKLTFIRTPSLCRAREVCAQHFRLGRQDDIGGLLLHVLLDQRHGHAGKLAAEGLESPQQRALHGLKKRGTPCASRM